jgi:hypothetical protein
MFWEVAGGIHTASFPMSRRMVGAEPAYEVTCEVEPATVSRWLNVLFLRLPLPPKRGYGWKVMVTRGRERMHHLQRMRLPFTAIDRGFVEYPRQEPRALTEAKDDAMRASLALVQDDIHAIRREADAKAKVLAGITSKVAERSIGVCCGSGN